MILQVGLDRVNHFHSCSLAQSFQFSQVLPLLKGLAIDLARLKRNQLGHEKTRVPYFPLYWLFDRDPYNALQYYSPHIQ